MKKSFIQWILSLFACAILVTSFAAFGQGSNCTTTYPSEDGEQSGGPEPEEVCCQNPLHTNAPTCDQCANGGSNFPTCTPDCGLNATGSYPNCSCVNNKLAYSACNICILGTAYKAPNCNECVNNKLDPDSGCAFCKNNAGNPPNCDKCQNDKLQFPACNVCINSNQKAPECTECNNPLHKSPGCNECNNWNLVFPACNACKNPNFIAPNCNLCKNGGNPFTNDCSPLDGNRGDRIPGVGGSDGVNGDLCAILRVTDPNNLPAICVGGGTGGGGGGGGDGPNIGTPDITDGPNVTPPPGVGGNTDTGIRTLQRNDPQILVNDSVNSILDYNPLNVLSRILGQLIIPVTNSTTSTTNTNTVNKPKLSTSEQKKVDTMQELIDKIKAAPTQSEKISLTNYLLEEVKDTTNNVFTNDDLFALLRDIFEPGSAEYEALALALGKRRVTTENICGDGIVEESESCDDGVNNGKIGYCSTDCLYASESQSDGLDSDTLNDDVTLVDLGVLDNAADKISSFVENGIDTLSGLASSVLDTYDTIITGFKDIVKANTSPEVQKILKKSLDVAQTVGKYTVVASAALLGSAGLALNFLIYKSAYTTYTVMSGDTMASIGNKFSMTDRALGAKNALGKNPTLKPGQKIRVKNRNLMEKDYLDQLKSVFNDELGKRKYGKMGKKIGDLFAKK